VSAATKFNSVVTNPGGTGTTITPTLSTHAAGDVIEIFVSKTGNASWSAPAGWTIRHQTISPGTSSTATVGTLLYRRVLPGDSLPLANPVCNLGATVTRHAVARTIRGADVEGVYVLPEWGATTSTSGTANPIRPLSVTTPAPEMFVTHYYCQRLSTNAPEPTGYAQDREVITSGTLVTNVSERTVADQQTVLSNQDVSPTSGGRWVGMISCVPSPDYSYYRAGSQAFNANATSVTPTLPAGTTASDNRGNKDLIIATVQCAGAVPAPNTPADWTLISDWSNTTSGGVTTVRKWQALYDGSLDRQFTRPTSGEIFVYFSVYHNAHQTIPVGTSAVQQNASSTTSTFPALARTGTKATVQATCVADATPTFTAPSGWTERNDSQGVTCADQSFNATGTTASASFTLSSASPTLAGLMEVFSVASVVTVLVIPTAATLTIASFTPTILAANDVTLVPAPASRTATTFAPSLTMVGTLTDDFDDNSRDTSKWTLGSIAFENAAVGVAEANQQVEITPLANTGAPAIYGYKSVLPWSLTGRQVSIRIAADIASDTEAWLVVALNADNYLRIWVAGGNLQTRSRAGGNNSSQSHGAFSFATHTYWRIRHDDDSDEIVWEYSTDGSNWTELRRLALPFAITSVTFYLSGGTGSSVASPALVKFDDFSLRVPAEAEVVTPAAVALAVTAFAPRLALMLTPASRSLTVTAFTPAVTIAHPVTPSTEALSIATFAPALQIDTRVVPAVTVVSVETFAVRLASVTTPDTATLAFTAFAPALSATSLVTPTPATLNVAAVAPVLAVSLTPATGVFTLAGQVVKLVSSLVPDAALLTTTTFIPALHEDVTPQAEALEFSAFAPTLALTLTPQVTLLTVVTFTPSLAEAVSVSPSAANLTITTFGPSVELVISATVAALSVTTFTPSLIVAEGLVPLSASLVAATFSPALNETITTQLATLALTAYSPAAVVGTGNEVTPDVIPLRLTAFAPLLTLAVQPASVTVAVTMRVPTVVAVVTIPHPGRTYVVQSGNYTVQVATPNREYVVSAFDYEVEYELV
jgi:hypothetical protein